MYLRGFGKYIAFCGLFSGAPFFPGKMQRDLVTLFAFGPPRVVLRINWSIVPGS